MTSRPRSILFSLEEDQNLQSENDLLIAINLFSLIFFVVLSHMKGLQQFADVEGA